MNQEELIDVNDHPGALNIQTESNGFASKSILYSEVHNDNLDNNLQHPVYHNCSKQVLNNIF